MFAATWVLAVCVGVALAAPHGTVVRTQKTVSVPRETVSVPIVKTVGFPVVKTVSVTHETVNDPPPQGSVVVVKTHNHAAGVDAFRNTETFTALDQAGSSLATAVGEVFTNLGSFLSELIRKGASARKVVVHQPVKKVVVHEPATATAAHEGDSAFVFQKRKTVLVN